MRPSKEMLDSHWEALVCHSVNKLKAGVEEIEGDDTVVLVNAVSFANLVALAERGQGVDDVEMWIWNHAPEAFKRAKRLLMNPSFIKAAKSK